jgi:trimeric autotransporter adhesin
MHTMTTLLRHRIAALVLSALATFGAHADSPATGQSLWSANCTGSGCHGNSPLTNNGVKEYASRNARAWIQSNINSNNSGMSRVSGLTAQQVADIASYVGNTPTSLAFASTAVGSTAAAQTITVYASTKAGYALSGISVSTTAEFTRSGGTCAATLATGTSCTVTVTFSPAVAGARSGTLNISHNNTLTPIAIPLSGTATGGAPPPAPVANISPASLTLDPTAIGATSAAQNVTVSNSGNAALSIGSITLSNTADYVIAGGTCSAGGTVAAAASCTVSVAFKPAAGAVGTRTGSLSIAHNAAGSPGAVSLTGNATAALAPVASMTASLAFGSVNVNSTSGVQTATLANSGNAPMSLTAISTGSSEFAVSGGSCVAGGSVAAGGNCTVNLTFTPSAAGARSANLTVTHNAGGGSSSTGLSGTGVALTPVIGVSPPTLGFSAVVGSPSTTLTVTVSNSGTAPLAISTLALGGAQAAEFATVTGTTCGAGGSVAVSSSCVIKLVFTPAASGARNGSLTITHNAAGSPSTVTLNGTGTATPQPAVSLNAASLAFNTQVIATSSAAQSVTLTNSGSAALVLSSLTVTGTAAADFTRGGTCTPTGTVAIGSSCTLDFTFTPGAVGARSATLTVASNASNGNAVLSLSGTGSAAPTPSVTLAPAAVNFGSQTIGVASPVSAITLTNSGTAALAISAVTVAAPFGATHNCGTSLAAGATCTLSARFTPVVAGAATGSISLASSAAGSPHTVALSGTGAVVSPVLAWSGGTTSVAFGSAAVGATPATRTLTLLNQGPGSTTVQQLTLAGANAADFSVTGGPGACAANTALAQGASCTVTIGFQPGAVGARAASLQVTSSGTNPSALALGGNGSAAAQPAATALPAAMSFTATGATAAAPQSLTLQSTGSAVLRVTGWRVASGAFVMAPAAANGCSVAAFDLMPGQACELSVTWTGSAIGTETGVIEVATSAAPIQVTIQAVRAADAPVAAGMSNVGGGGCSIARGESLTDPTLIALAALAALVMLRRRIKR